MKVYRGYNKEVGPISYAHWTYVTPDIEQAKYYATKDGEIKDGSIIEYDLDLDNLRFISLDKLNSFAQSESEIYSEEDLLWYQEGLGESLYKYIAGVYFTDPYNKDHTIYIVFSKDNLKNGRVLSKEEFDAIQLKESVYENELNEVLRRAGIQLDEREDLTKFNRIAGFYNLKTKQFDLFPRTSEDISVEDDEVNDYIHNVHSKDEFTEFNIVRFGIEDIPGEGVVCYIEGDTKRNVEKCYYAILEKYAEECDIIKYELEYYVGNEHKYIFLDRYGKQIMESANKF